MGLWSMMGLSLPRSHTLTKVSVKGHKARSVADQDKSNND